MQPILRHSLPKYSVNRSISTLGKLSTNPSSIINKERYGVSHQIPHNNLLYGNQNVQGLVLPASNLDFQGGYQVQGLIPSPNLNFHKFQTNPITGRLPRQANSLGVLPGGMEGVYGYIYNNNQGEYNGVNMQGVVPNNPPYFEDMGEREMRPRGNIPPSTNREVIMHNGVVLSNQRRDAGKGDKHVYFSTKEKGGLIQKEGMNRKHLREIALRSIEGSITYPGNKHVSNKQVPHTNNTSMELQTHNPHIPYIYHSANITSTEESPNFDDVTPKKVELNNSMSQQQLILHKVLVGAQAPSVCIAYSYSHSPTNINTLNISNSQPNLGILPVIPVLPLPTSKTLYTPYSGPLKDKARKLGGLGANYSQLWKLQAQMKQKAALFAKEVAHINKQKLKIKEKGNLTSMKEPSPSARQRSLQFARSIPKLKQKRNYEYVLEGSKGA